MPKLSIIVATYNLEGYLRETLDGLVAQTLSDIEIIVVDDGSSDATPDIIRDYAARDDRIRPVFFQENSIGGVATPANAGLDLATGDFIGFADGDDLFDPRMFEILYNNAVDNDADLAMCRYHILDVDSGRLSDPAETRQWLSFPEITPLALDTEARRQILRFIAVPWRKIYRRELVERANLRFPVGDYSYEDNPFHWAAVLAADSIVMIPERLCKHRHGRVGATMSADDARILRLFDHHDTIRDILRKTGKEEAYRDELLRWLAMQLSWISRRVAGDARRALYDKLVPIVAQYPEPVIAEFTETHGPGETKTMLDALRAEDYAAFSKAAELNEGPRGNSILARVAFHLRAYGVRHTAGLVKQVIAQRMQTLRSKKSGAATPGGKPLSQRDLMTAHILLQREVRALRAEVRDLRRQLEDTSDRS